MKSPAAIILKLIFAAAGAWVALELYGLPGETSLDVIEQSTKSQWKPHRHDTSEPHKHTNVDAIQ